MRKDTNHDIIIIFQSISFIQFGYSINNKLDVCTLSAEQSEPEQALLDEVIQLLPFIKSIKESNRYDS